MTKTITFTCFDKLFIVLREEARKLEVSNMIIVITIATWSLNNNLE